MVDAQKHIIKVQPGMTVIDSDSEKVGTVSFVHPGIDEYISDWSMAPSDEIPAEVPQDVVEQLPGDAVPAEIRQRMVQLGFMRINTGVLSRDRHALADQIARVDEENVYLTVTEDDLSKA